MPECVDVRGLSFSFVNEEEIELQDDLEIVVGLRDGLHELVVRAGFVFDGASGPLLGLALLGLHPLHYNIILAAVVHDALYRSKEMKRRQADKLFHLLLRERGVGRVKAAVIYAMVKACGWRHYGRGYIGGGVCSLTKLAS